MTVFRKLKATLFKSTLITKVTTATILYVNYARVYGSIANLLPTV